ncbi:unnamed protein product, partial [Pleuronectes platessa]
LLSVRGAQRQLAVFTLQPPCPCGKSRSQVPAVCMCAAGTGSTGSTGSGRHTENKEPNIEWHRIRTHCP